MSATSTTVSLNDLSNENYVSLTPIVTGMALHMRRASQDVQPSTMSNPLSHYKTVATRRASFLEGVSSIQPVVEQFPPDTALTNNPPPPLSTFQTFLLITILSGMNFANSMSLGLYTIGVPVIAADLQLADSLQLWPASVLSLASGCTLLLAGSIADFVGNRVMNISGCFFLGIFILASGLSQTGIQLIIFRALQGIAVSMCFPTAFSILTESFPNGRRRNIAFSCLGLCQPLGWSIGLFLGGVFENTSVGWRFGFYLCAAGAAIFGAVSFWILPSDRIREPFTWSSFGKEIDWIGAAVSSVCLGLLSYIFAILTGDLSNIRSPANLVLLCIAVLLIPVFIIWMRRQERLGKPAFIPNSIWGNAAFTSICIMVILTWAALNSMELFLSLYFQQVQLASVIQTSIYFLPNIILGIIFSFCTGLLIHRVQANHLVLVTSILAAASPVLMALINPAWSWWYCAFWAVLLSPLSGDVIFTVANLIITDVFPPTTQALAGAVFSTVAQFGTSVGIAVTAVISASVIDNSGFADKKTPEALMVGYRAVFWTCFAAMVLAVGTGAIGLRKVGRVGLKSD